MTLARSSGVDIYQALTRLARADTNWALMDRSHAVIEVARWRNSARLAALVLVWGVRSRVHRRGLDKRQSPAPGHSLNVILPQLAQNTLDLSNAGMAR